MEDIIVGVKQELVKTWTVERDILDPRLGANGLVRMKVFAFTSPEALRLAEAQAFTMREDFIRHLSEKAVKDWGSWGWKLRDEFNSKYLKGQKFKFDMRSYSG